MTLDLDALRRQAETCGDGDMVGLYPSVVLELVYEVAGLRGALAATEKQRADLRAKLDAAEAQVHFRFGCAVWAWLADNWESEDGWEIAEMAVEVGLAARVKYDPALHGECDVEPGDSIIRPLKGDPDTAQAATEYRERIVREERARVEHSLKSALEGESYFEREAQRMRELVAVHHPPEINEGQASCFLCDAATHLAPEKFHRKEARGD